MPSFHTFRQWNYPSKAVRRFATHSELIEAADRIENGDWGEASSEQVRHNEWAARNSGTLIGQYRTNSGQSFLQFKFKCHCGQWRLYHFTQPMWRYLACLREELLLATCPCVWRDISADLRPQNLASLTPDIRKALDLVLNHIFHSEFQDYWDDTDDQREFHVFRFAAMVERWLNGTREPFKCWEMGQNHPSEVTLYSGPCSFCMKEARRFKA